MNPRLRAPEGLGGQDPQGLAVEHLTELVAIDAKIKARTKELKAMVKASGSRLMDVTGVGPIIAARMLADVRNAALNAP